MIDSHSHIVTLQSHALQQQARFPDAGGTLAWILSALSISCKIIANKVRRAQRKIAFNVRSKSDVDAD